MHQQTCAEVAFEQYRKPTRREQFLDEMNRVVPWADLVAVIEPVYPKAEGPGRPPVGVERMLRLHCLQQWFNLSDPAVEEALYDSRAMLQFVGIALGREPVPDETTICKFRQLLEAHQLGEPLFARIGAYLATHGMKVSRGTINVMSSWTFACSCRPILIGCRSKTMRCCGRSGCRPASRWPPCASRSRNSIRRRRSRSRDASPTIRGTASPSTARSAIRAGRGAACISSYRSCDTT